MGAIIIYGVRQPGFRLERETKIRTGGVSLPNKEGDESVAWSIVRGELDEVLYISLKSVIELRDFLLSVHPDITT